MRFPVGRASERVLADIGSIRAHLSAQRAPQLGEKIKDADALRSIGELPTVTDPALLGAQLDMQLAQPVAPMPPIGEAPDAGATLAGKPLIDTVLEPGA